jgi:hypothetical protein
MLQQLAKQAFGGLLVAPALDEGFENEALLVNRAPEPMLLAGDGELEAAQVDGDIGRSGGQTTLRQ